MPIERLKLGIDFASVDTDQERKRLEFVIQNVRAAEEAREQLDPDRFRLTYVLLREEMQAVLMEIFGRTDDLPVKILPADYAVRQSDKVKPVMRKRDSNMNLLAEAAKTGEVDAALSFGHTGAWGAAARLNNLTQKGILPALGVQIPRKGAPEAGGCFVADLGFSATNPDPPPEFYLGLLLQTITYVRAMTGIANPKVGFLSFGEEIDEDEDFGKATENVLSSIRMFQELFAGEDFPAKLFGTGLVEPKMLFAKDGPDIVLTNAFVGNIMLKTAEAVAALFKELTKDTIQENLPLLLASLIGGKTALKNKFAPYAPEYPANAISPIMGLKRGNFAKGHAHSSPEVITAGIIQLAEFALHDFSGNSALLIAQMYEAIKASGILEKYRPEQKPS